MTLLICGIYDSAIQSYTAPLHFRSELEAVRAFTDAVRDPSPNNSFHKHPDDYELRLLATFDPASGVIIQLDTKPLIRGKDIDQS